MANDSGTTGRKRARRALGPEDLAGEESIGSMDAAELASLRGDIDRRLSAMEERVESGIGRTPCQVHLHPSDAARLSESTFRAGTEIVPDVGVARGDVQIETPQGLLVHDLDEALARLAARLEQELA